jgi:hypothetical protein
MGRYDSEVTTLSGHGVMLLCVAIACLAACDVPAQTPGSPAPLPVDVATASPSSATASAPAIVDAGPLVVPTAAAAPVAPPHREGAYANVDPSDDDVPGPPDALADCDEQLARAGVVFKRSSLPVHKERKLVCGAPQVVVYRRGPGQIVYDPTPLLTCPMALALASFERIVQQQANEIYGSPVVRIDQLGTYSCREMAAFPGWVSEHSYANAIDLSRFTLKSGAIIEVQRDFDKSPGPPARKAGMFLRTVSQRAFDEDVFSHVLTPFFDAHHRDHFHVDLARYRGDGTRA